MKIGFQTASTMQCNLVSDIRWVREAGFQEIELMISKMEKYFKYGFTINDLKKVLNGFPITMLDALYPFEPQDAPTRERLRTDCVRYCEWAQALGCKALQTVALDGLLGMEWREARKLYAASLRELAIICKKYDVNLGVEPLAWSPFNSLQQCLELIDLAECDNIKINVDTFHLWAVGTALSEVEKIKPEMILSVHLSDTNQKQGVQWCDDDRTAIPGEGVVPLKEYIQAIKATGFDGVWSAEMWSRIHYEWDPEVLVKEVKRRVDKLFQDAKK